MLKKFFRGLAESKEQKQRARYLRSFEEFATKMANEGAPVLAEVARRVARMKQELDSSDIVANASESLEVDFDQLATNLCDRVRDQMTQLAKLHRNLPTVVSSADEQKLSDHFASWQAGLRSVQVAYSALKRTGAVKLSTQLAELTEAYDTSTPIGQAVEALLIEVRTAERIRNELG